MKWAQTCREKVGTLEVDPAQHEGGAHVTLVPARDRMTRISARHANAKGHMGHVAHDMRVQTAEQPLARNSQPITQNNALEHFSPSALEQVALQ